MRAIIISKDKKAIIKKIKDKDRIIQFREGLYPIEETGITNYVVDGNIKGSEIIFFEGNPNNIRAEKDESSKYLKEKIIENALQQVGSIPFDIMGYVREIKNTLSIRNVLLAMMVIGVIYAVIHNTGLI